MQVNSESERDKICEFLRKKGIDTAKLFSKTPSIAKESMGIKRDAKIPKELQKIMFVIPNHFTLSKKELDQIVNTIKMVG